MSNRKFGVLSVIAKLIEELTVVQHSMSLGILQRMRYQPFNLRLHLCAFLSRRGIDFCTSTTLPRRAANFSTNMSTELLCLMSALEKMKNSPTQRAWIGTSEGPVL